MGVAKNQIVAPILHRFFERVAEIDLFLARNGRDDAAQILPLVADWTQLHSSRFVDDECDLVGSTDTKQFSNHFGIVTRPLLVTVRVIGCMATFQRKRCTEKRIVYNVPITQIPTGDVDLVGCDSAATL